MARIRTGLSPQVQRRLDRPFACIFDAASHLAACLARGQGKRPPRLAPFVCAGVPRRSGPWLTFHSALTDTGRRLSKHGPSNGGCEQARASRAHARRISQPRPLNEPGAV